MVATANPVNLALVAALAPALAAAAALSLRRRRCGAWIAVAGVGLGLAAALAAAVAVGWRGAEHRVLALWARTACSTIAVSVAVDVLSAATLVAVTGVGLVALLSAQSRQPEPDGRQTPLLAGATAAMAMGAIAGTCVLAAASWAVAAAAVYALLCSTGPSTRRAQRLAGATGWLTTALLLSAAVVAAAAPQADLPEWLGAAFAAPGVAASSAPAAPSLWPLVLVTAAAALQLGMLPFHAWLTATAAAPASVAAVAHGAWPATGVYMLVRCHALFAAAPGPSAGLVAAAAIAAVLAALAALASRQLRGGLACATAAQAGLAVPLAAAGTPGVAAAYLLCLALARAGLCLAAGAVSGSLTAGDRLAAMGGLRHHLPLAAWSFSVCAVLVAGMPPWPGYWSAAAAVAAAQGLGGDGLALLVVCSLVLAGAAPLRLVAAAFLGPSRATALAARASPHGAGGTAAAAVLAPLLGTALPLAGAAVWFRAGAPSPRALLAQVGAAGPAASAGPAAAFGLAALLAWALWRRGRRAADEAPAGAGSTEAGVLARAWGAEYGAGPIGRALGKAGRCAWTGVDTVLLEVAFLGGLSAVLRGLGLACTRLGDGYRSTWVAAALAAVAAAVAAALWGTP